MFYFGRFSRTLLQNKVRLSLPLDICITQSITKEFVNTFRDFERRILKYKRAEVVSSHVGLVSHELCPGSTLELVITSFETNITDFLIGLIAHAKECFILQLL